MTQSHAHESAYVMAPARASTSFSSHRYATRYWSLPFGVQCQAANARSVTLNATAGHVGASHTSLLPLSASRSVMSGFSAWLASAGVPWLGKLSSGPVGEPPRRRVLSS
jgi:hypothetical protein